MPLFEITLLTAFILDDVYHLLEDELDRAELQAASVGTTWLEG